MVARRRIMHGAISVLHQQTRHARRDRSTPRQTRVTARLRRGRFRFVSAIRGDRIRFSESVHETGSTAMGAP
jgi:hypothetical protein